MHGLHANPIRWKVYTELAVADVLVYISVHAYTSEVMPYHIHCVADALVTFTTVELYNGKRY